MIHVIGRPTAILMAFQEKDEDVKQYKDHPIYGVAVPAPEKRWYSRGLVFDRDLSQTIEIKRLAPRIQRLSPSNKPRNTDSNYARTGLMSRRGAATSRGAISTEPRAADASEFAQLTCQRFETLGSGLAMRHLIE